MLDVKIIFVDIDWTIYDHKHKRFDRRSIIALKHLQKKNNIKIIICTARPYHSIKDLGLFKRIKPDGYIAMNGAYIKINDYELFKDVMPKEKLRQVVDVTIRHNLTMELSTKDDRFLIAPKNDYVDLLFMTFKETMPPLIKYENQEVLTALLFAPKSFDEVLKKEYPKDVKYYRFADYGVDVLFNPHEKGEAVHRVLGYFNIPKYEAMAFGDDYGDISMFKMVQYGVAMNNGRKELKDHAFYIAPNVWDRGVYKTLKKFGLIKKFDFCLF